MPQYQISDYFSFASRWFYFDFGKTNKVVTIGGECERSNLIYIYKYKEQLWMDAKEKWRRWPRQYNRAWVVMMGMGELYYIILLFGEQLFYSVSFPNGCLLLFSLIDFLIDFTYTFMQSVSLHFIWSLNLPIRSIVVDCNNNNVFYFFFEILIIGLSP